LSADQLNSFRAYLEETRKFVNTVYVPDLKAMAGNLSILPATQSGIRTSGAFPRPDIGYVEPALAPSASITKFNCPPAIPPLTAGSGDWLGS
jgi:hypothetical protein